MKKTIMLTLSVAMVLAGVFSGEQALARTKLTALPERGATVIRLDHPSMTLIEEERVLTLQQGVNRVDFSWKGVNIDPDSIRLTPLSHPDRVTLLNVSYPPGEAALVWEIGSEGAFEETVRISYLLRNIDRLVTYKFVADKEETHVDLKSFLILRNFSGEDFENARVLLDYGEAFERGISHEETRQLLFLKSGKVPVEKVWTFDAAKTPWDPEKVPGNVGIPVSYVVKNDQAAGLGKYALWGGKVRAYQEDGAGGTIVLGEDRVERVPVGEDLKVYIGESRDIVVTQRMMRERRINVRRNQNNRVVLYDTDEQIKARIENFKDSPARLTMIQHIPGHWDMETCNMEYERKNASTLEFKIQLPPKSKRELVLHYHRRNLRP